MPFEDSVALNLYYHDRDLQFWGLPELNFDDKISAEFLNSTEFIQDAYRFV
jgi:hypothetical protein